MLDSNWCAVSDASWLAFKAKLFGVIKLPMPWSIKLLFGLFIILMVITYPWIIRQPGLKRWLQQSTWQRSLIQISISVLLMGLLLLSPPGAALANQALVGFLPVDSGEPVDAIVILGRGQRFQQSRVDVASDLWWGDRAPVIFASGTGDAPAMLELLRQKGIPDHVLAGENCSLTTEENAQFSAHMLKPKGIQDILLVTDPHHMWRSLLTFQSFGFKVIPHLSAPLLQTNYRQRVSLLLTEYSGLVTYALRGRFLPRASSITETSHHLTSGDAAQTRV